MYRGGLQGYLELNEFLFHKRVTGSSVWFINKLWLYVKSGIPAICTIVEQLWVIIYGIGKTLDKDFGMSIFTAHTLHWGT